jgi:hypothetical protein
VEGSRACGQLKPDLVVANGHLPIELAALRASLTNRGTTERNMHND